MLKENPMTLILGVNSMVNGQQVQFGGIVYAIVCAFDKDANSCYVQMKGSHNVLKLASSLKTALFGR